MRWLRASQRFTSAVLALVRLQFSAHRAGESKYLAHVSLWTYHERQEYQRNHAASYTDGKVAPMMGPRPALRRVK